MIKLTLYKNYDPSQPLIISANTLLDLMKQLMTWMDENKDKVGLDGHCQVNGLTVGEGQGHIDDFVDSRRVVLLWDKGYEQWAVDVEENNMRYRCDIWAEASGRFVYYGVLQHAVRVYTGLVHASGIFEPYPAIEEIDQVYMDLFDCSLCGIVE